MSAKSTIEDVISGAARWCVIAGEALPLLADVEDGAIDAIVTDPPYASTGDAASMMSKENAYIVPKETQFYEAWAREHLREWVRVLSPSAAAWFTCDWRGAMAFDMAAHKLRIKTPVVGVWDRGGLGMGHILRKVWEAFVVVPMPSFKRRLTDEPDLWRVEWTPGNRSGIHAAEKPEALMRRAVRLVSDVEAVVLDPFGGSGTTGVAALLEGRRAIVIERDADHCEVAAARCAAAEAGRSDWRNLEQCDLFGVAT